MILRNQTASYTGIQVADSLYVQENLPVYDEDGELIEVVPCARLHTQRGISQVRMPSGGFTWQFTSNSMAPRVVLFEPETSEGVRATRTLKRYAGAVSPTLIPEIDHLDQSLVGWTK